MLIHLSEVLAVEGKTCRYMVPVGFQEFSYHGNLCPVSQKSDMVLTLENEGDQKVLAHLQGSLVLQIPCDRCLEDTEVRVDLDTQTDIDMRESADEETLSEEEIEAEQDRLDNQTFMEGYQLDTDKLLMQELELQVPEKVLCRTDCKGICYRCGKNLNNGPCDCEEEPKDLRMAAILDLFQSAGKE